MPMIVTGNVRSLRNKIDELAGLIKWNYAYRESSMICLTETWLHPGKDPDTAYTLDGYTLIRGDRTEESGKTAGGGLCFYINSKWCKNFSIFEQKCSHDIEYLTIILRPFYLPREFSNIVVTLVYIPPSGNANNAEVALSDVIMKSENKYPDAINIITGDFNHCEFSMCIPHYQQCINFNTRSEKLLDLFYCNIKNSYYAKKLMPLGVSDHDMCHLVPAYRQKLKRSKPTERTVYNWNADVNESLLACMECTDFEILFDDNCTIDQNVDVLNEYIHFCTDMIVPSRVVKCFPNNKPWVTKDLKELLTKKKQLIACKDRTQLKDLQRVLDKKIADCKRAYKLKVENLFKSDAKSAWQGLRVLTGMEKSAITPDIRDADKFCNDLNIFYGRFDISTTLQMHGCKW